MERMTDKRLKNALEALNVATGNPVEAYSKDSEGRLQSNIGHYCLDYAYGGVRLVRMVNTGGAQTDITGRGTKREAYEQIHAAIRVLREFQEDNRA